MSNLLAELKALDALYAAEERDCTMWICDLKTRRRNALTVQGRLWISEDLEAYREQRRAAGRMSDRLFDAIVQAHAD